MQTLKVDKIFANDKDFNGNPYINKFTGKPEKKYKALSGELKVNIWGTQEQLAKIKEGDVLEGEMEQKEFQGKPVYAFKLPKPDPMAKLNEMQKGLDLFESRIFALEQAVFGEKNEPLPEEEPDFSMDDIPF